MIIAVSGKGGTGKTMVSALLIRAMAEKGKYDILAIDSDPDSNLPEALGVEVEKTIGEIREELLGERDKLPIGTSWQQKLEYEAMRALVETDEFDLLSMGRPEGPGCYCAANNVLREIIDTIAKNYDIVIIDTEAGLEHLSRRTTQNVDIMLVVTDTSKRGITTAARIKELAGELKIKFSRLNVIMNRVTPELEDRIKNSVNDIGLEVAGTVPEDELIREFDVEGKPLTELPEESKAYRAIKGIANRLELG
ncbi:MAG TPA: ATP-binding protein [Euryarchaeota archaeon]|nr:septum site-determining protein MinD [archaeon BMS3Bbin15]HDL15927.1 ATP-binding protein [Euryarchaeota archaeon]